MQSTVPLSSSIQDLNMEFVKIYDTNNVKLTLNMFVHETNNCTYNFSYLNLSNVLNTCSISQYTHGVSKKFEYFVSFLR